MDQFYADLPVSSRWIEALTQQASIISTIFGRAGFEPIAPPVIQPADLFLDLIGEDLRSSTYVFTDPDGAELCLRPDLTIPATRLYLDRFGDTGESARFSYNGGVFRYQRDGHDLTHPREFRQAGIEYFAAPNPAQAEAEILALSVESIRASGLRAYGIRIGDVGIFEALLDAIQMPERWRARLNHHFWHPAAFRRQLQKLVKPEEFGRSLAAPLLAAMEAQRKETARHGDSVGALERHLETRGLTISGTRTLEEIAAQLEGLSADLHSPPLDPRAALLLDAYVKLAVPARQTPDAVRAILKGMSIDVEPALARFDERLRLTAQEGVDISDAPFSGGFGRQFEYYTGFVFGLTSPILGDDTPLGGGGRYDSLVDAIRGHKTKSIAAVGSAIHTERLLLAVRGGHP
ncbi:MAG: ATP phosphoribosyltransferase regulatory subunit [Proteobacteria bacterium]|nr:ATP phosphoribosyltransferase regulatory subunit [Pseudomonadota bacterium]